MSRYVHVTGKSVQADTHPWGHRSDGAAKGTVESTTVAAPSCVQRCSARFNECMSSAKTAEQKNQCGAHLNDDCMRNCKT
jgi:hypothetical protein